MIFLSSLPRSGSTLLTCLLNQRPDVYATPTSNLCDTMGVSVLAWERNPTTQSSSSTQKDLIRVLKGIAKARYTTKKTIFDKSRAWPAPQTMQTMKKIQGNVKIVATVRPIADCLASLVKIANPTDVNDFCKNSNLSKDLFHAYHTLKEGYESAPANFLFVEYDDLIKNTQEQLDRIAKFTGLETFTHDFNNVEPSTEKDEVRGIKDLHKVRKKVSKRQYSVRKILGDDLYRFYQGGEFWNDKPEPVMIGDDLNLQLEASLRGEFNKASEITEKLLIERPNCNRVKFNAGWHELYKGNLLKGHKLLDYGRAEDVFGSKPPSPAPVWQGEPGTVLFHMEAGQGDQIKSLRYAFEIAKTNKVVLACSPELAPIFAESFITVKHDVAAGVYHDFYCPSMSSPIPLKMEMRDITGEPYIKRTEKAVSGRVGVRWQGNPEFDHDTHRKFPSELMFDATRELINPVSLQRDTNDVPEWMEKVNLSDWTATRREISLCELVITSCTSVAHMSAAMGVPTWIVVPILPYYLWAMPGTKSPFYDSVTLFRQEKYGDWSAPFEKIKQNLQQLSIAA